MWFAGPVERRISPPMKNAITIYHRGGNITIYVTESAFSKEKPSHNPHRIVQAIIKALNELEGKLMGEAVTEVLKKLEGTANKPSPPVD